MTQVLIVEDQKMIRESLKQELEGVYTIRQLLAGGNASDVTEQFISMLEKTTCNREFLSKLNDWVNIYEKEGYTSSSRYGK